MQQAAETGMKPSLLQNMFVLLFDSLGFAIYLAVSYLIASPFFRMHWSIGVVYLIPLVWGFFLFMVGPLAEDGQTPGQRSANVFTTRKDGKEYVRSGSTGGIGYIRATLFWIITRGIVPLFGLWVLFTNFTYVNLALVIVIFLVSLLIFALVEDSLFGLEKVARVRESRVRARIRGFWEKRKIARPQLPLHGAILSFLMLVDGIGRIILSATRINLLRQEGSPLDSTNYAFMAAVALIVLSVLEILIAQTVLAVRSWSRWATVGVCALLIAVTVSTPMGMAQIISLVIPVIVLLDFLLDPTARNAFAP